MRGRLKDPDMVLLSLEPVPPFRLDLTVWALRRRTDNLIDRWDGSTYRRVVVLDNEPVEVAVTQTGPPDRPKLQVAATGSVSGASGATERIAGVGLIYFHLLLSNLATAGYLSHNAAAA